MGCTSPKIDMKLIANIYPFTSLIQNALKSLMWKTYSYLANFERLALLNNIKCQKLGQTPYKQSRVWENHSKTHCDFFASSKGAVMVHHILWQKMIPTWFLSGSQAMYERIVTKFTNNYKSIHF